MKHENYSKLLLIASLSLLTVVGFGQSIVKSDTDKSGVQIYAKTSTETLIHTTDNQCHIELALQRRYFLYQADVIIKIKSDVKRPSDEGSFLSCKIELMPENDYELKIKLNNTTVTKQDTAMTVITGTLFLSNYELEVLKQKYLDSVRLSLGSRSFEYPLPVQNRNLFMRLLSVLSLY